MSSYLRFHQTETPEKITIMGKKITLVRKRIRMALPVHVQPAVFGLFGADGNQIFIRGQPVHHVENEIAIADRART